MFWPNLFCLKLSHTVVHMKRRGVGAPCSSCLPLIASSQEESRLAKLQVAHLEQKIKDLEAKCRYVFKHVTQLYLRYLSYYEQTMSRINKQEEIGIPKVNTHSIISVYPKPGEMRLNALGEYVQETKRTYPVLAVVLALFLSDSHQRKVKAHNTQSGWHLWSNLYQSFIIDVFMRSRQSKAVRPTTMLLSTYMLLGNIPDSCWRLLQRLKLVASKNVVEEYIKSNKKIVQSQDNLLMYVFDNCDWNKHVTNVRSEHRSKMMHIVSRYATWLF